MPKTGESRFIPKTLPDFQKHSPNNEACIAYLSPRDSPVAFYAAIIDNTKIMQDYQGGHILKAPPANCIFFDLMQLDLSQANYCT